MNDINKKGRRYYSRGDLQFSSDVTGAKQRVVAPNRTMMKQVVQLLKH